MCTNDVDFDTKYTTSVQAKFLKYLKLVDHDGKSVSPMNDSQVMLVF